MEVSTFEESSFDELKGFAKRLEDFILIEQDFVQNSLVIALSSKYGSGKTTFFNMWKNSLENPRNNNFFVISLNAWESDYFGDPLFAIISALVESIEQKKDGAHASSIVEAVKDFGWFATVIGNQIAKKATGIDAIEAGEIAKKQKKLRNDIPDSFSLYQHRKSAMLSIKESVQNFVSSAESNVLFLVDELDRCRPDYAISYLETIKHIFDINGAVFILAADRQHLENSARTAFGPGLDFEEYYRKFIHREISLPKISDQGYRKLTSKYVKYYLEREAKRYCFMGLERHRIDDIIKLIKFQKLTPRQIQEIFRILGHVLSTHKENQGKLRWCLSVGSIVMSTFKVAQSDMYNKLGDGELLPEDAKFFLKKVGTEFPVHWWMSLFYTGGGLYFETSDPAEAMRIIGIDESNRRELGQWNDGWGWGNNENRFADIREKIEYVTQWD